jgi:hypothetical protein
MSNNNIKRLMYNEAMNNFRTAQNDEDRQSWFDKAEELKEEIDPFED